MVLDALAAPHTFKDRRFLIGPFQRNQNGDMLADDLLARVAVYPFRALVPACDDAIEVLAYDCVITRLDNRSEPAGPLLAFAQRSFDLTSLNKISGLSGKHIQEPQGSFRKLMGLAPVC